MSPARRLIKLLRALQNLGAALIALLGDLPGVRLHIMAANS